MKTTFSLCFALLTFGLFARAQNETYPACMANSCGSLRNTALSQCDYDFFGQTAATSEETTCICGITGIDTPLSQCIACVRLNPDLTSLADSYASICTGNRATALPNSGNNSTSTTTTASTNTTISSSTRTTSSSRTTRTSTTATTASNDLASQTSEAPAPSDTSGANSNIPGIALALVIFLAQAGL